MKLREKEAAEIIQVTVTELRLWVDEGWIAPTAPAAPAVPEGQAEPSLFDEIDIARARLILELREDCALPDAAIPVVLSLLDQIHGLRGELKSLAAAIDAEPEDVRARIKAAYRGGIKA